MPRSLFARLAYRLSPQVRERHHELSRRDVLKGIAALGAAGMLSGYLTLDPARAAGLALGRPRKDARRVIVIGAGLAGLACAYELRSAGYQVRVIEARRRLGGRVLSFTDMIEGGVVEAGGEFVGASHTHWMAYADRFRLTMKHASEGEELNNPVMIGGEKLSFDEVEHLYGEMALALGSLNKPATDIDSDRPWLSDDAEELDRKSLAAWADDLNVKPRTLAAIRAQIEGDNGVPLGQASYLGMLAVVKGGGLERYWTETETHRCVGGNARLAAALAEAIGFEAIVTGLSARKIVVGEETVNVTLTDGTILPGDEVVLAIPPSTWDRIEFDPVPPAELSPQMGSNSKMLAHVKSRFWLDSRLAPDALADGPIAMTWEATDGQDSDEAVLTGFAGAGGARELSAMAPRERDEAALNQMERLYPGLKAQLKGSRFMDWPADNLSRGSYSFPAPGQVCACGPLLARPHGPGAHPRLHFAGEHTLYAFVGYMEAALASGVRVAKRIAERDGVLTPAK